MGAEQAIATAVEGPPGSGKTTYCQYLYRQHCAASQLVIVPELLAAHYNCGDSNQFHDIQSIHKEQFALALRRHGFSILMDRCRISTVVMRITQGRQALSLENYRSVEQTIFGDHRLSVTRLILLATDLALCKGRRRALAHHESRIDLDERFFASLHRNYQLFFAAANRAYPDVEVRTIDEIDTATTADTAS